MCRNIKTLYNFDPPVTDSEIELAALQFVRKITGIREPSGKNQEAFILAVDEIKKSSKKLLDSLTTTAMPKNREIEAEKRRLRFLKTKQVGIVH